MRQEVQVYVTMKLKGLNQRFEESDQGDRQMGFVVITIKYLQLIDMGGVFTLKSVLTSIQYHPCLSYPSRRRNEFPWSQANPK